MSRASRARSRCCRPRCSSCGAGASGGSCAWPRTRAAAACRVRWHGSPRMRSSASIPAQQAIARELLLRLADEDESGAIVRRRVALDELDTERTAVVARLVDRRLLTAGDGAVEVAHEALLREWPRLRAWLDEDAEGRRLHRRVEADAARVGCGRARSRRALPRRAAGRGARLGGGPRSRAQRDRAGVPRRRPPRGGRAQRRLRLVLAGVASLLVLAVIAGLVALDQRGAARARGDDRGRAAPRGPGAHGSPSSTARCCSPARASRSTTRRRRAATCSRHCSGAQRRSACCTAVARG